MKNDKTNSNAVVSGISRVGGPIGFVAMDMMAQAEKAPQSRGKRCFIAYLSGKKIGLADMVQAKCFECCGYYWDGRHDCGVETCALYPRMPYGKHRKRYIRPDRRDCPECGSTLKNNKCPTPARHNGGVE